MSIFAASASRNVGDRKSIEIGRDLGRIGDDAVANTERALGRFDQAVDMLEAVRLRDAQPIKQREDDE